MSTKSRRVLDRDAQISELKRQLADMESIRQRKQLDVLKRNEAMMQRDAIRHEYFVATYKTPEQLAEEAAAREVMRLQGIMDLLRDDEDDDRMLLEEEETVECKLMLQMHRLAFVCLTVAAEDAEFQKLEHQKVVRQEALQRVVASYDKLKVTLGGEEGEKRRQLERACTTDWRVFENMKRTDYQRAMVDVQRRLEEARQHDEAAAKVRDVEDQRIGTKRLEEEEEDLLRAYEERAARIALRYQQCIESPTADRHGPR